MAPGLHAWAHHDDAGHEDHECAAKLIAAGSCDTSEVAVILVVAPAVFVLAVLPLSDADVPGVVLVGGLSERGPPVVRA